MTAGALMTMYPVTVTPQATIAEALDLMRDWTYGMFRSSSVVRSSAC